MAKVILANFFVGDKKEKDRIKAVLCEGRTKKIFSRLFIWSYRTKYRSDKEFKKAVDDYMIFYNSQRPHSNNNYRTPDAKEAEYYSKNST